MAKKPRKKIDTGEGNLDMIKNSVKAIKHHADELTSELKKNPEIEAWVLAKVDRAAQNLSDVTHYLDGEMNKFAKGGEITYSMSNGLRKYYMDDFPNDDMGKGINPKATFRGLKKALEDQVDNIYDYIGVGDSIIRERLFSKLADIMNVNYDVVYEMWNPSYAKGGKTPIVRTQFEEEEFEYAKGGQIAYDLVPMIPYGVKGMITPDYKKTWFLMGTEDEAFAKAKEMANSNPNFVRVEIKRKLKTKTNIVGIVDGQNKQYAKGGLLTDYSKISSVEVEDIDMNDAPDFVDAYISYAEYDGEPMTDEQLEELNQDGDFVYSAVERHLYKKGGKVNKRWIQDAIKPETKGALRATAKRKGLLKGDEKLSKTDLHKLEKMGGKTARRARFAETLRDFKK